LQNKSKPKKINKKKQTTKDKLQVLNLLLNY